MFVGFCRTGYSHDGDDVASLDLVVPHTPAVQQDDVTVRPALRVQEGLHTHTHTHTHTLKTKLLSEDPEGGHVLI